MNKYKKLWLDYYDQVVSLDGLEQQVEQAEHVSQLQRYINYKMKPIYQSDKDWCNAIATESVSYTHLTLPTILLV